MKQAIIIGSSGQVARALMDSLKKKKINFISTSSSSKDGSLPLDLSSPQSIVDFFVYAENKFGKGEVEVFLVGALTHVDRCETSRDQCLKINAEGPKLVAEECKRLNYALTFFSSEYVFGEAEYNGGAIGPFSEEDPTEPTSWYGKCKVRAEKAVLAALPNSLIVRTTMVFSWDPKGMNFFMQLFRHLEALNKGEKPTSFRIPEDQISTPTFAPALADATVTLREKSVHGIVNVVGADLLSRKDFVLDVIKQFKFDSKKCLTGFQFLKTKELGQVAKRPLSAGLKTDKARGLGVKILTLKEAFSIIKDQAKE